MAAITVTYSFTNGTTADADQVDQNFTDIINGTSDGTKDFSISALTAAGTATFNGNVTLGNASGDDITFTGSLASSIPIKTDASFDIGTSTIGLGTIYFGGNSKRVGITGSASMSATWTLTLPITAGVKGQVAQNSGSGTLIWVPGQTDIKAAGDAAYTVLDDDGFSLITCAPTTVDRTITLPTASDNTDRKITIKHIGTGDGTTIIDGESSETIDGSTTYTLYETYDTTSLLCDGTTWHIIEHAMSPLSMTDEEATRLGHKVYAYNVAYNGSVTPSLTTTGSPTVNTAYFIVKQLQDGTWQLEYHVQLTYGGSTTVEDFTINAVTFTGELGGGVFAGSNVVASCKTLDTAGTVTTRSVSGTNFAIQGVGLLASKPSWAY